MHFFGEGMINYLLENIKISSSNVQALVLASNPHSPFESIPEIERSLSQSKIREKSFLICFWRMALKEIVFL